MKLKASFSPGFKRDLKKLKKKYIDCEPLNEVINLVLENTSKAKSKLKQRHKMHLLNGKWDNCYECHIANFGDWLLIWISDDKQAVFLRTGTHDELF